MDVFINGNFVPAAQAAVSVQDRGLLYGDGLFETLRAEAGGPVWLRRHLKRLTDSAAAINITLPTDFPWEGHICALLRRNALENSLAAVKILVTRGETPVLGLPPAHQPTIILYARPYTPPTPAEYREGWPVVSFPEPRRSFLSRHKSLNYLFCLAARQYALDHGGREGLIFEADGSVSEGAATALLWQEDKHFFTPSAPGALPSVTLAVLREALSRTGIPLMAVRASVARLAAAAGLWLANSLMGLLPVASLDGRKLPVSPETEDLNRLLWSEAG